MAKDRTPQDVLWENVTALMRKHYGAENLNRLARDAGIGPGTATRLKERRTSTGIGIVAKVAAAFPPTQPWHLLLPDFDPDNPAVVANTEDERKLYARLKRLQAALIDTGAQ